MMETPSLRRAVAIASFFSDWRTRHMHRQYGDLSALIDDALKIHVKRTPHVSPAYLSELVSLSRSGNLFLTTLTLLKKKGRLAWLVRDETPKRPAHNTRRTCQR
jgi:hypothetical protein